MNPSFKNMVVINPKSNCYYQCELEGLTAGWLLETFTDRGEDSVMYFCEHIAVCIETARLNNTTTLVGDGSASWGDDHLVTNDGYTSSGQLNYQMMVGARFPKKVLATARKVLKDVFSYDFDSKTGYMSTVGLSCSIVTLLNEIINSGCVYSSQWVSKNFPVIPAPYSLEIENNIAFRRMLLQRIQDKNPDFVFPTMQIAYRVW